MVIRPNWWAILTGFFLGFLVGKEAWGSLIIGLIAALAVMGAKSLWDHGRTTG